MPETSPLEEALHKATAEPEARNAFYHQLMNSAVHVVGQIEVPEIEGEPGHIQLKHWQQPDGSLVMPFFATLETLKGSLGEDEPHLEMPVVELFRRTRGITLVLTAEGTSKAFKPSEVDVLLSSIMALDPLTKALLKVAEQKNGTSQRDFYQLLINSKVFVIGHPKDGDTPTGEVRQMAPEDQFIFASCDHPSQKGTKILPFFSSLEFLSKVLPKDGQYITFQAITFFSMARPMGIPLVLNLGSDPHKLFSLEEIDFILGAARQEPFETRQFKPGSKIILSPPATYPQEMVGALLDFLPKFPVVKTAYLTIMREDAEDAPPVMVIGFEADGDLVAMFRQAGDLVEQYGEEGLPVDFAEVKLGEAGLSTYFLEKVSPFYRRPLPHLKGEQVSVGEKTSVGSEQLEKPGLLGRLKKVFGGKKAS